MIVESNGKFSVLDRKFPTRALAESYLNDLVSKRERLSGRKLATINEITKPLPKQETRTLKQLEQFRYDFNFVPAPFEQAAQEPNPYRRQLGPVEGAYNPADPRPMREQQQDYLAKRWDAEHEKTEAAKAFDTDATRVRLRKLAAEQLETAEWSPEFTAEDVETCKANLRQCEGCLTTADKRIKAYATTIKARADEKVKVAKAKWEELAGTVPVEHVPIATGSPETNLQVAELQQMNSKETHVADFDFEAWRQQQGEPQQ